MKIKNLILLAPGKWNSLEYTVEEIKKAFKATDWTKARQVFIDFKEQELGSWVGFIENQRLKNEILIGDLVLPNFDKRLSAMKEAKLSVGIAPSLKGKTTKKKVKDFTFNFFSLTTMPSNKDVGCFLWND